MEKMLQMPLVFSDHMVFQRDKEIAVWGKCEPNKEVTATFDGINTATKADAEGNFMLHLPKHSAGRNYSLTLKAGDDEITYTDVKVGDVFIAGGQSNMEYLMATDADKNFEIEADKYPEICYFGYPEYSYEGMENEFPDETRGFWRNVTAEDLPYFSAVGYYFAKRLNEALDVPIGILACNWGGTPASAWLSKEDLVGELEVIWKKYEDGLKGRNVDELISKKKALIKDQYDLRHEEPDRKSSADVMRADIGNKILYPGLTREEQLEMMKMPGMGEPMPIDPIHEWRPAGLYYTMLLKVVPYTAKGVIWYQGESDSEAPLNALYNKTFGTVINRWRKLWNDDLPFMFVQLAPYGEWLGIPGTNYPIVRDNQEKVTKEIKGAYMASIGDAGMLYDIHPKHKRPVGERLAELAIGHVYNAPDKCRVPGLCDAPEFKELVRNGSSEIRVKFNYADGLHTESHKYQSFKPISVADDKIASQTPADKINAFEVEGLESVSIDGNDIVLKGNFAPDAVVKFAYRDYYEVNLYNKAGIPVKPFKAQ